MTPSDTLAPVAAHERLDALDVVRGIALLGIFAMNMEFFARPLQDLQAAGIDPALSGIDRIADALVYFFVQGKFWTLFSLLFGMGFAVMIDRARAAGRPFVPVYLRRSLALLGIGAAHALLVWSGDILVSYALGALVLLGGRAARRAARDDAQPMSPKALGWLGASLFALPMAAMLAFGALGTIVNLAGMERPDIAAAEAQHAVDRAEADRVYGGGTYAEAIGQRARDLSMALSPMALAFSLPGIVGIFVIGMAILRSGVVARPQAFGPQLRRVRNWGLVAGLGLMAISVAIGTGMGFDFDLPLAIQVVTYMTAGLVLALAYAATAVLALEGRAGGFLRRWIAPAGRMALTNYLLQSVFGTLLFYGYGLGMWGRLGRAEGLLFAVGFFALQLVLSRLWLAHFRFGPAEWLWRALTYLQLPPLRRAAIA